MVRLIDYIKVFVEWCFNYLNMLDVIIWDRLKYLNYMNVNLYLS